MIPFKNDFEDEGFFYLGDLAKPRTDYSPLDDYMPLSEGMLDSVDYSFPAVNRAFEVVKRAAAELELPEPLVYFADLEGSRNVAMYIDGTHHVFLLDLVAHQGDEDELTISLLHELGHAFLDSVGVRGEMNIHTEEEAVEWFAREYTTNPEGANNTLLEAAEEYYA